MREPTDQYCGEANADAIFKGETVYAMLGTHLQGSCTAAAGFDAQQQQQQKVHAQQQEEVPVRSVGVALSCTEAAYIRGTPRVSTCMR